MFHFFSQEKTEPKKLTANENNACWRKLPVSSVKVKKICATLRLAAGFAVRRIERAAGVIRQPTKTVGGRSRSGFVEAPFTLEEGLERMLRHEFG